MARKRKVTCSICGDSQSRHNSAGHEKWMRQRITNWMNPKNSAEDPPAKQRKNTQQQVSTRLQTPTITILALVINGQPLALTVQPWQRGTFLGKHDSKDTLLVEIHSKITALQRYTQTETETQRHNYLASQPTEARSCYQAILFSRQC